MAAAQPPAPLLPAAVSVAHLREFLRSYSDERCLALGGTRLEMWQRIWVEDVSAPFAFVPGVNANLQAAIVAARTNAFYQLRRAQFDRVAWYEVLKNRVPTQQADYAMAQFREPLNNQRKRAKVFQRCRICTRRILTNQTNKKINIKPIRLLSLSLRGCQGSTTQSGRPAEHVPRRWPF